MRSLTTAGQALLDRITAGEQIPMVQFVQMNLATPLYYTTAGVSIVWGGHTWVAIGGKIEPISDSGTGEVDQLQFTLPGITDDDIALALSADVEGKTVLVYDALIDPITGEVADAPLSWTGSLNVPAFEDGPIATVTVTAEHRAIQAMRPKVSRYTDDEQRRLFPGDTSLDIDPDTDALPLPWPAASYFKQ